MSSGKEMEEKKDKFRERKPLFALALSFLLTGLGQLYNGKPRKGILFLGASLILPFPVECCGAQSDTDCFFGSVLSVGHWHIYLGRSRCLEASQTDGEEIQIESL
jgi:hypothetical protein